MEETPDIAARQAAELAELAAQGMEMARAYAAAVKEAMELGDWHHGMKLGQAHARTARCVRLTHILEARLAREARLGLEEDRKLAEQAHKRAVDHRQARVRALIDREIREADPDETSGLDGALYGMMIREARDPAFLSEDLDTLIARIRKQLGLISSSTTPVIPDAAQPRAGTQEPQAPEPGPLGPGSPLRSGRDDGKKAVTPSAHSRAGGDPRRASILTTGSSPDSAWIPASAGTSGEGVRIFNSS